MGTTTHVVIGGLTDAEDDKEVLAVVDATADAVFVSDCVRVAVLLGPLETDAEAELTSDSLADCRADALGLGEGDGGRVVAAPEALSVCVRVGRADAVADGLTLAEGVIGSQKR